MTSGQPVSFFISDQKLQEILFRNNLNFKGGISPFFFRRISQ